MNLLNLFNENITFSGHRLISLCEALHICARPGEVVSDREREMYCLFYSVKGGAMYKEPGKISGLPAGSLLFLSCSQGLRLRASDAGWEAWLFYMDGHVLPLYYEAVCQADGKLLSLSPDSPFLETLNRLIRLERTGSLEEELVSNTYITDILSGFISSGISSKLPPKIPSWLAKIKEDFDQHYSRSFTLDSLSLLHKVSKYRLCREFSKYYGLSPIKYLNKIRIQNACLLLVSGDMHINEIAAAVGIENTNHFIRLFKAQLDMTPMQYRQGALPGSTSQ